MDELITIESICYQLKLYKSKKNLTNRVNRIHFLIFKYFLQIESEGNNIFGISKHEVYKLKEIGIYLFNLATDEMFKNDMKEQTRKDLFNISLNIFEQLCKIYKERYEEFKNGYLELLIITVSCAALGDNPSKAYVIFNKYMTNIYQTNDQDEVFLFVIIAFFSKQYGVLNIHREDIMIKLDKYRIRDERNIKHVILEGVIENIYKTIEYFDMGKQRIINEVLADLDKLYIIASEMNCYREIWIIKKMQRYIELSRMKSLWHVLEEHLREDSIKALLGNKRNPTYELWSHQIEIINNNLLDLHTNNIINIPTSSGKSLIAQICILKILQEYEESTCIYVVPTNALLNQVKRDLNLILTRLNINVDTLISGYDIISPDIEETKVNNSRVLIVTQEKLDSLIRKEDDYISKCKLFIFDEFHNISSNARGLLLEFVVSKIKMMDLGDDPKLLFLSAVLPNVLKFKEWIGSDITKAYSNTDCRPTKQVKIIGHYLDKYKNPKRGHYDEVIESGIRVFYENNKYEMLQFPTVSKIVTSKKSLYNTQNFCADLAERFTSIGNVLVYLPNINWFKSFCKHMANKSILLSSYEKEKLENIANYVALTLDDDHYLVQSIRKGIAYHHKKLPDNIKRIIEIAFKEGIIKVLAATTTLAQGLNFPISTIILGNLSAGGSKMKPEEIENLIGRAGRAMRETEGYVIFPISLKAEYPIRRRENYILHMKNEYLYKDINSIKINSAIISLIEALKKDEEELEKKEKEIIMMYNSIIFDLEEIDLLQEDEDYLRMIQELFYSVDATVKEKEELIYYTKEMVSNIRSKINVIEDNSVRKILKNSGLSVDSAISLYNSVRNNFNNGLDYIFENRKLNPKFMPLINEIKDLPEFETNYSGEFIYNCINSWIFMDNYKIICEKYFNKDFDKCIDFISQDIIYKGSWYFSLIYQLYESMFIDYNAEFRFEWISLKLLEDLSNLAAYCKFGVEDRTMIELMENGLYERELLIKSVAIFKLHTNMETIIPEYFYEWGKNANLITIEKISVAISMHDIEQWNIFKSINKEREDIYINKFIINIKGYGRYETRDFVENEPLILRHEIDNLYDEFAIEIITLDNKKIGYIDRQYSKYIYEIIKSKENRIWAFLQKKSDVKLDCKVIVIK